MLEAPPSGPHHLPEVAEAPLLTPSSESGCRSASSPRRPRALRFPAKSVFFLLLGPGFQIVLECPRVKEHLLPVGSGD